MIYRMIFILIIGFINADDSEKLAVFDFKNEGLKTDLIQQISNKIRNELTNTGSFDILDNEDIKTIIANQKINLDDCSDSCMSDLGRQVGANQILSGTVIVQDSLFTITAILLDIVSGKVIKKIDFETEDKNELLQFGIYYLAEGLAGEALPSKTGVPKMYTVILEAISISDSDFFRTAFGEPYPIYIILTENGNSIWKTYLGNLRGFRTLQKKITLAYNPESLYELKIYDPGFKQEFMYYRITSDSGSWPFQENKHNLGQRSFIELRQKLEPDIVYKPNKIIY